MTVKLSIYYLFQPSNSPQSIRKSGLGPASANNSSKPSLLAISGSVPPMELRASHRRTSRYFHAKTINGLPRRSRFGTGAKSGAEPCSPNPRGKNHPAKKHMPHHSDPLQDPVDLAGVFRRLQVRLNIQFHKLPQRYRLAAVLLAPFCPEERAVASLPT